MVPDDDTVETLAREERAETVRRAVGALTEELRLPLILSEYEERSHAEIAAILNCSTKTGGNAALPGSTTIVDGAS